MRPSRWVKILAAAIVAGALAIAALYLLTDNPTALHAENGPIETVQLAAWLLAAAIYIFAAARGPRRADLLMNGWRAVIALAVSARELDLHEKLNSDVIGRLGVHYRIDWWLDGAVPLGLKAGWATIFLVLLALLLLPPLMVRPPTRRLLLRGDAHTWLFLLAFAFLFLGYALDDFLGRGTIVESIHITQGLEESVELCGVGCYLASAVSVLRLPFSARIRHAAGDPR